MNVSSTMRCRCCRCRRRRRCRRCSCYCCVCLVHYCCLAWRRRWCVRVYVIVMAVPVLASVPVSVPECVLVEPLCTMYIVCGVRCAPIVSTFQPSTSPHALQLFSNCFDYYYFSLAHSTILHYLRGALLVDVVSQTFIYLK